jgi:uncharacterized protein YjbI with pentapeptide repeats
MEQMGRPIYPLEGQQLTREEVRIIVAEAHVWQKRADQRRADLRQTNLIGADLREADLEGANLSGARLDNAVRRIGACKIASQRREVESNLPSRTTDLPGVERQRGK